MKLVTIEDLKDGDIIANDVMLEDYTVVLGKGTVIKEQYIEKLRDLSIFTVYIEEKQRRNQKLPKKIKSRKRNRKLRLRLRKIRQRNRKKISQRKLRRKNRKTDVRSLQWKRLRF